MLRAHAEEAAGDEDVDADIGEEQEVGHGEHADDGAKAAQLRDLHDLPGLLGHDPEEHGSDGAHDDDHGAGPACQLVTVADADRKKIL